MSNSTLAPAAVYLVPVEGNGQIGPFTSVREATDAAAGDPMWKIDDRTKESDAEYAARVAAEAKIGTLVEKNVTVGYSTGEENHVETMRIVAIDFAAEIPWYVGEVIASTDPRSKEIGLRKWAVPVADLPASTDFSGEFIATVENRIALYSDGSGTYSIHRDGDRLMTVINGGDGDAFVQKMTRAEEFDNASDLDEWKLTDTFASAPVYAPGEVDVVWINGEAFEMAWDDDAIAIVAPRRVPTPEDVTAAIAQAKREILSDIGVAVSSRGEVMPVDVADFSTLHDYVDANEYGGLCDESTGIDWIGDTDADDRDADVAWAASMAVQDAIHEWLKAGRPMRTDELVAGDVIRHQMAVNSMNHHLPFSDENPGITLTITEVGPLIPKGGPSAGRALGPKHDPQLDIRYAETNTGFSGLSARSSVTWNVVRHIAD